MAVIDVLIHLYNISDYWPLLEVSFLKLFAWGKYNCCAFHYTLLYIHEYV